MKERKTRETRPHTFQPHGAAPLSAHALARLGHHRASAQAAVASCSTPEERASGRQLEKDSGPFRSAAPFILVFFSLKPKMSGPAASSGAYSAEETLIVNQALRTHRDTTQAAERALKV